jgi:hypothetical protein
MNLVQGIYLLINYCLLLSHEMVFKIADKYSNNLQFATKNCSATQE